uniref:Muscle M-line assembly protein unc-89 n=1 Tax=Rhabditophanes sp. KR3021 TaxID=114890 RepID=A0AC35UA75_9BILA
MQTNVPGSYFESPTQYYKQRKITRELADPTTKLSPEQEAIQKREQAYGDLLKVEEEFAQSLGNLVENYIKIFDGPGIPIEVSDNKHRLTSTIKELYNFHAHVMLKGLEYYSDDPVSKVGHTFLRLEKDFSHHVVFGRDYPDIMKLIEEKAIKDFLNSLSDKVDAGSKTYADYLTEINGIMTQYEAFFKEFIKYSQRANCSTKSMAKAVQIIQSIPRRSNDLSELQKIRNYQGDITRLGGTLRQDLFQVWEGEEPIEDKIIFLILKNKLMFVDKVPGKEEYNHYATIRLDKYSIREHTIDVNSIVMRPNEPGIPFFRIKPCNSKDQDIISKAWLKDINDMQELLGPEEGPPSKKTKSPPVISPTASSASIFSGCSSVDWTTTGTTLEMQGTRVTKTQYGFRTLQESSAKMCLKVSGFPLPSITWYKDDVLLNQDERHTFYADDDGFFAMTIDPVKESDTGNPTTIFNLLYSCRATNEYGQASTSAFFRVVKAEKEAAPPSFETTLKDQECNEGDVISFEALINGWPEPDIIFLVDQTPLQPSADFKLQYDGHKASLEIKDAQTEDSGVVLAISNAILHVEPDPDKNFVAPEFQGTIEDVECNEFDTVKFKAVVTGDPEPTMQWCNNGVPLTPSEKVTMIQEDGICILTIKDVTRHFDGKITCKAKNRLSETECEGLLKIRIPLEAPNFEKHFESRMAVEKETISFECIVSGWETPLVTFFLNGNMLIDGVDGVTIFNKEAFYRITFKECTIEKHDGELLAKAVNASGSAESRARVTIDIPDESSQSAPMFVKDLIDQKVKEGEMAVFETTVRGHPTPQVQWFINGSLVDNDSQGVSIETCNCDHKITIDSANYAGTVIARSFNTLGVYESKARLIVLPNQKPKRAPEITEHLRDKTANEGSNVLFEVRADGEPLPTFEWKVNGEVIRESEHFRIKEFNGSSKLEIINLKVEECGEIVVTASNEVGTAQSKAGLLVNKSATAPQFVKTPDGRCSERGTEQRFEALATGFPEVEYVWFINGRKVIPTTVEAKVESRSDRTSVLIIDTTHVEDEVLITVTATNTAGIAKFETNLQVKRTEKKSEPIVQQSSTETVVSEQSQQQIVQSNLERSSSTTTIEERYHEEGIVSSIPNGTILIPAILVPVAIIPMVGLTTSSNVITEETETLETTTTTTTSSSTTTKSVKELKITRRLGDCQATRGDLAHFETVIENAVNVIWLFNGIPLVQGPTVKMSNDEHYEYRLTIDTTEMTSGEGSVGVKATSEDGNVIEQTAKILVEEKKITEKPEFTDQLKKINVTEGQSFTVDVIALNQPTFVWSLNGVIMEDGRAGVHITGDGNKSTLVVDEAGIQHNGEIKVVATNLQGTAATSADVVVEPKKTAPKFEKGLEDKKVTESDRVSFAVRVSGFPEPTVRFFTNEGELPTVSHSGDEYFVTIDNIKESINEVRVTAENPAGKVENSCKVSVDKKQTTPKFEKGLEDKKVTESDRVSFAVRVSGFPEPTVRFFTNEGELPTVSHSGDEYFVTIDNIKESINEVRVTAENPAGKVESSCKVIVDKKQVPPTIEKGLQSRTLTEGEKDVEFSVKVSGFPEPSVTFSTNEGDLPNVTKKGDEYSVKIGEITDKMTEVKVSVESPAGVAEQVATITVEPKQIAPNIGKGLEDKKVVEGSKISFTVQVTGLPEPSVSFSSNEGDLPYVVKDGEEYTVTIDDVKKTLKEVVVEAKNGAGSDRSVAKIEVSPKIVKPTFTTELSDKSVEEGEPIKYSVKIDHSNDQTTVQWILNDQKLEPSNDIQMSDLGDGNHELVIVNPTPQMSGTIQCVAINPAGEAKTKAKLTITNKPPPGTLPTFTKPLQDKIISEGEESVKFWTVVEATPAASVSWYLDDVEITPDNQQIKVKFDQETGKTSIRIFKATLEQSGKTVKVKATNAVGQAQLTANLIVEKKQFELPIFVDDMKSMQVVEGSPVTFSCNILAEPTVSWEYDGKAVVEGDNFKIAKNGNLHTLTILKATADLIDGIPQSFNVECKAVNQGGAKSQIATLTIREMGCPPNFSRELVDLLVTEKEMIMMICKLGPHKPEATVSWFKNGEPLDVEGGHWKVVKESDGQLKLSVLQSEMSDQCRITVKAVNSFGSCESSASIGVQKRQHMRKPEFLSQIPDTVVREGDSLVTKVIVSGNPAPVCVFSINGQMVAETEDTELTNDNGVYSMTIHGCVQQMSGIISVRAFSKMGEVTTQGKLTVIAPVPVEFESSLCDATCREGDVLKLKAVLLGEPFPTVTWLINDVELKDSDKITIQSDNTKGTYTVTIKDITLAYSGICKCVAKNPYGEASSSASLLVLPRCAVPDFTEWLQNQRVRKNTSLTQKVIFIGDNPEIKWFIQDEEIFDGGNFKIVTEGDTSTLTIKNFDLSVYGIPEDGHISVLCSADNESGSVTCTANIAYASSDMYSESESDAAVDDLLTGDVSEIASDNDEMAAPTMEEFRAPTPVMAPHFIKKIKDITVKKGDEVRFSCVVPFTKGVVCKYFKDGKEIELIARIRVTSKVVDGILTEELIIEDSRPDDKGNYVVVVTNEGGQDKCEAYLEVTDVAPLIQPVFSKPLQNVECRSKDKAVFECVLATTNPQSQCQWYKGQDKIEQTDSILITSEESGLQKLTISSVKLSDANEYKCVAQSEIGRAETSAKLIVKTEPPTFTKHLSSQVVSIGDKLVLECSVSGEPMVMVEFWANGQRIQTGNNISVQHDVNNVHWRIVFNSLTKEYCTEIKAVALNDVGRSESVGTITQKIQTIAPEFTKKLNALKVVEHAEIEMSVVVTGTPDPEVHFQKDGVEIDASNDHVIIRKDKVGEYSIIIKDARVEDAGIYSCHATNPAGMADSKANFAIEKQDLVQTKLPEPFFIEELKPQSVTQNENVTLLCKINEESNPQIRWYKDSKPLDTSSPHLTEEHLADGTLKLTIMKATPDLVGVYECVAVNPNKVSAVTKAPLEVKFAKVEVVEEDGGLVEPVFIEPLQPVQVQPGETVELGCKVNEESRPSVHWTKDKTPIKECDSIKEEHLPDGSLKLTIQDAKAEDVGVYECIAQNKLAKATTQADLTLDYGDQNKLEEQSNIPEPFFITPLQPVSVTPNQTCVLQCKVNEESKPTIQWFKDNTPLSPSAFLKEEHLPDGTLKLTILNATPDMAGAYRCVALNPNKVTAVTKAELSLQYGTEATGQGDQDLVEEFDVVGVAEEKLKPTEESGPPEFVEMIRSCTSSPGGTAVLKCKVKGTPRPTIKWSKDSVEIKESADVGITYEKDGTVTLTIKKVSLADDGTYHCHASNEQGTCWTEGPILVVLEKDLITEGEAPDFLVPIKPVVVFVGESAVLEGKICGSPRPSTKWYKNQGEQVKPDNKRIFIEDLEDGTQRLTIKDVTLEEKSNFRCEATNDYGDVWADATLTVKPRPSAPVFSCGLKATEVKENEKAVFDCKIEGEAEVCWLKDGKEVKEGDGLYTEVLSDGTHKLVIEKAKVEDGGRYTVVAAVEGASSKSEADLKVTESDSLCSFKKGLTDCELSKGQDLVVEIEVDGKVKDIKFYKNGKELGKGEELGNGKYKFVVKDLKAEDFGEWCVRVSNSAGTTESKANISEKAEAKSKPQIVKGLSPVSAKENEEAKFEIETKGDDVQAKWTKNGADVGGGESLGNGKFALIIPETKGSDAGEIKVVLTNSAGQISDATKLSVEKAKEGVTIKSGLKDVDAKKGDNVRLEIEVGGKPKQVKFYKNGNEIETKDVGNNKFAAVIDDVSKDDEGDYTVKVVDDDNKELQSSCKLTVKLPAEPFKIVKGLEDQFIPEGKDGELVLKCSGIPKTVKWYKNGNEVSGKLEPKKVDDNTFKLAIPKAELADSGDYEVELIPEDGSPLKSKGKITVERVPKFTQGLQDQSVKEGEKVEFEATTTEQVRIVKWYSNGSEVKEDSRVKLVTSGSTYKLIISKAEMKDLGEIKITLSNSAGQINSEAKLTVTSSKVTETKIEKGLVDQTVEKGAAIVFEIKCSGENLDVVWLKNGQPGVANGKVEKMDNNTYRLTIPKADVGDTGNFTVKVKGQDGKEAESSCKLTVKLPAEPFKIVKGLEDQFIPEGKDGELVLKCSGIPKTVKWYKNGNEVSGKLEPKKVDDNTFKLVIPKAELADSGDYEVELIPEDGSPLKSKGKVTVERVPKFTQGLQDQSVKEGEKVEFEATTTEQVRIVKWYSNGSEVKEDSRVKLVTSGSTYKLIISKAEMKDLGEIKITLSNSAGQINSEAKLTVTSSKATETKIDKGLVDQTVAKADSVIFQIKCSGDELEVVWLKNGRPVTNGKAQKVDDGTYKLTIPKVDTDDEGTFTVKVKGADGKSEESSCKLTVKLPSEPLKLVKGLEDQFIPENKDGELEVKVSGKPKIVRWYKNGSEVSGKIEPKKVNDNTFKLIIPKAGLGDGGEYAVELSHEDGGAIIKSKGKVTVECEPKFSQGLQDQTVKEDETITFEATTTEQVRVVKWYKNGREVREDSRTKVVTSGSTYKLVISKAEMEDCGEYKISLENCAGQITSSAKCTVLSGKPDPPKITKGLEDVIVAKGDAIVFEIKCSGEDVEVVWSKNGRPGIANGKAEKIDHNTYTLTIPKADLDDAAEYTAQAQNKGGKCSSKGKAEVDEVPKIVRGLVPANIEQGDEQVFRVQANCPIRQCKWYSNGVELTPSTDLSIKQVNPKTFELTIHSASKQNHGDYKVVLSNKAGSCESEAPLDVNVPEICKLIEGLNDENLNEGEPLVLKAKIDGKPKSFKWLKNGAEITPSDNLQLSDDGKQFTLTIPSTARQDGATYKVVFTHDKGTIQSSAVVYIRPKRQEPVGVASDFIEPLSDVTIPEGETLILKCRASGEPTPTFTWFKDDQEIKKEDRVSFRVALDGTASLRILDAKKSDGGQYMVKIKNASGEKDSSCKANVIDQNEVPSKPRFVIPLQTTDCKVGEKVEFHVKIRGFPKPEVTFYINNTPVKNDDRCEIEDIGDGHWTLLINPAEEGDFGTVSCKASNAHGEVKCDASFGQSMSKTFKPRGDKLYPPRFNSPLWDRRLPQTHPAAIECHVDAKEHALITWYFEGKVVDEKTPGIEINNTLDGCCRLKVLRLTPEWVGMFTCHARNSLGSADTRSCLNIEAEKPAEPDQTKEVSPRFFPYLKDQTLDAGQKLTLYTRVEGMPTCHVAWYHDGLPLKITSNMKTTFDKESGECTLTITDIQKSDMGAYRITASNCHGATNTACLVTVKCFKPEMAKGEGEPPFFTKNLTDKWVDRGGELEMSCTVSGVPFPELTVYKNGVLLRESKRVDMHLSASGVLSIRIRECSMTEEGIYRVEASNSSGQASTSATVHIDPNFKRFGRSMKPEGEAPKFVIGLDDLTVALGNTIELNCKVTGSQPLTVKFTKDGIPLFDDSRYEWNNNVGDGCYSLRINNARHSDAGTIRAIATNEEGSSNSRAFIRIEDAYKRPVVLAGGAPPRFSMAIGDVRGTEGSPLKIVCKIEPTDAMPQLVWYRNGEKVLEDDNNKLSVEADGTATLYIAKCSMDDDGIYRVVATSPAGSAQCKGNAIVKRNLNTSAADNLRASPFRTPSYDSGKAPQLIIPLENVRVSEKQGFKLKCKFSGERLEIQWYKDGNRIYSYEKIQILDLGDGCAELEVISPGRFESGTYRAVCTNEFGSCRTLADVIVETRSRGRSRDYLADSTAGSAPGFTIPLFVKRCKVGESVTFECLPFGKPFPDVKFLKDGMQLHDSADVKIESQPEGMQRLTLSNVTFEQEGYYRCVVSNAFGTASTKAELTVQGDRSVRSARPVEPIGEPEESKPRIRRGLHNMSTHQGNTIEFQVCVTGNPIPTVKWFKDGEEIKNDSEGRRVVWTDERGIHHLVIVSATLEDQGDYALEATNKLGSAKTECCISVIKPKTYGDETKEGALHPPGFIRQLKNKHVFTHLPTIFDCLVVGTEPPTVEFYHNDTKIINGGRYKIQSCGGGSHALILLDTLPEDAGRYVCVARNSSGTATSSAVLDVTVPYLDTLKFHHLEDVTPYLTEEYGFKKVNYASYPTPPDRGPFIKEVTGHYLTLSWIPTKRSPPRYPQVTYVVEIRELPEKDWSLLDYNIPEPVCKVRNLEIGKSYQFRVRAENIYGISEASPSSPPSRLMAPPGPTMDKNKKIIPLLDPYAEKALNDCYSENFACAPWFAPGVVEKRYCAENDTLIVSLHYEGYPNPDITFTFRGHAIDTTSATSLTRIINHGNSEAILSIKGFKKENVGQYQCIAKNLWGEAQQNFYAEIATRPHIIQPLTDKVFSDGKPLRLDVRIEGVPDCETKWMKEWHPIVNSARVKCIQDGPYLYSLIITDPIWRDSGIYSILCTNVAGQTTCSCTVTVEGLPFC